MNSDQEASSLMFSLARAEQLADALHWRIPVLQSSNVVQDLVRRLEREVAQAEGAVKTLFDSLSYSTKASLVRHPYIAGHLRGLFRTSLKQLALFVARRTLEISKGRATDSDRATVGEQAHLTSQLLRVPYGNSLTTNFTCVFRETEELPILDNGSSFARPISAAARNLATRKLEQAILDMAARDIRFVEFIDSSLWHIALMANPHERGSFSSRSFQALPGLSLLANPESESVPSFAFEEALVHESVHSFLFFAEDDHAPLLAEKRFVADRVRSPWTGNTLDVHTGVHALVVWLVLAAYWKSRLHSVNTSAGLEEFATRRLTFIRQGIAAAEFPAFWRQVVERVAQEPRRLLAIMLEHYHADRHGIERPEN